MAHTPTSPPTWDTASLGRPASASALEHSALSAHLTDCGAHRSRLRDLRSGADGLRQILSALSARAVTTALVLALLLGALWLLR